MFCEYCNHTGRIPLKKAVGFINCECNQPHHNGSSRQPRPEDYDYPMSWDNWRSICRLNGWADPGSDRDTLTPDDITIIDYLDVPLLTDRQPEPIELTALLKQNEHLRAQLANLQNHVTALRAEQSKKANQQDSRSAF